MKWVSRDLALPLVLLAVQLTGAAVTGPDAHLFNAPRPLGAADWVLLVAGPVALAARRRYPVAALAVCLAAVVAPSGTGFAHLSFVAAFFVTAASGRRYAAWLALAVAFTWVIWFGPLAYGYAAPPVNDALLLTGWVAALVIAAEATRIRAERAAATRAGRLIEQRRRRSEERLRIARDLHDVIGHNISLINVQASMGLDLMDSQPGQARAALAAIKSASKEALEELRTMLTTLRQDEDDASSASVPLASVPLGSVPLGSVPLGSVPLAPAPRLDRLPELIDLTRAAGLSVEVEVAGQAPPLPAAVHVAAYRIIQESLTNVARHAGRARVRVRVAYGDADVRVQIDDDGAAGTAAGTGRAGTGTAGAGTAGTAGTGTGIAGMRERAAALGGELSAGFRPGGGFRVSARLPVRFSQ